jgi:uncharacterized membrane protein
LQIELSIFNLLIDRHDVKCAVEKKTKKRARHTACMGATLRIVARMGMGATLRIVALL